MTLVGPTARCQQRQKPRIFPTYGAITPSIQEEGAEHIFFSAFHVRDLGQSFPLQKEHFVFDVSGVPSFDLSLLFPFSLPLRLPFSLPLRWLFSFAFALAFAFLASYPCSLVALSLTYLHHSESCGLCCQYCCFDCVPERVQILRLVLPYRTFPLLQGLTSASRERTLQQLHHCRSISTSVHRLPLFHKSSPELESIHWIA